MKAQQINKDGIAFGPIVEFDDFQWEIMVSTFKKLRWRKVEKRNEYKPTYTEKEMKEILDKEFNDKPKRKRVSRKRDVIE